MYELGIGLYFPRGVRPTAAKNSARNAIKITSAAENISCDVSND